MVGNQSFKKYIPIIFTAAEEYAFYECNNLTNITFNGAKSQWDAIGKERLWNGNASIYAIHCTDGDL